MNIIAKQCKGYTCIYIITMQWVYEHLSFGRIGREGERGGWRVKNLSEDYDRNPNNGVSSQRLGVDVFELLLLLLVLLLLIVLFFYAPCFFYGHKR